MTAVLDDISSPSDPRQQPIPAHDSGHTTTILRAPRLPILILALSRQRHTNILSLRRTLDLALHPSLDDHRRRGRALSRGWVCLLRAVAELEGHLGCACSVHGGRWDRGCDCWECCWWIVSTCFFDLFAFPRLPDRSGLFFHYRRILSGRGWLTECRLAGVYSAGFFRMSTWIPFSWGVINALVLIISSFAIQGGM